MPAFSLLEETTWNNLFSYNINDDYPRQVKYLSIPNYQRAYVWNESNAVNLLINIKKSCETNDDFYYLGDIVLCKKVRSKDDLLIVDGQQRLTTLTILVSTIRYIAREKEIQDDRLAKICNRFIESDSNKSSSLEEKKYKLCIPFTSEADYGYEFRRYIQNNTGLQKLRDFSSNENNSVIDAYVLRLQLIVNKFYELLCEENEYELIKLVNYIGNSCLFVVKLTDKFRDAHRIFCSINIAGQQLSAIEFIRARIYGEVVKESEDGETSRQIEAKQNIFKIIKKKLLKESEMNKFLLHVCRLKMIESNNKNEFLNSFSTSESSIIQYFSNYSDEFDTCDLLVKNIKKCFEIWESIFINSIKTPAKEMLKTLRDGYWQVWITIALMSKLQGVNLNEEFWSNLEKYICINFVLTSQKHVVSEEHQCNEVLTQNYDLLVKIMNNNDYYFEYNEDEIELFSDAIKRNVDKSLKEDCIKYLLLRLNISNSNSFKHDLNSIEYKVIGRLSGLNDYDGHIGNLILIDKEQCHQFSNDLSWNEKKEKIGIFKKYKFSSAVLKEKQWNTETFILFQSKYMKQFGTLYKIENLVNFQLEPETYDVVEDNSNNISRNNEINWAASEIYNCINRNLNSLTEYKIRNSLGSIESFKQRYISKDEMLALLIRLRTHHKIYKRRKHTTFLKWIKTQSNGNRCEFIKVFLNNQQFFSTQ
jgi:uncharacterized protein with ParB-like and HNH nuclease domain